MSQVIQMSSGSLEVSSNGIVVLAFAGNVPVTALVSRGCVAVSEVYQITDAGGCEHSNKCLFPPRLFVRLLA